MLEWTNKRGIAQSYQLMKEDVLKILTVVVVCFASHGEDGELWAI